MSCFIYTGHAKLFLQCLNLSYNNLGPCSGSSLSQFLSLTPNLSHLYLEDCSLSDYTLELHTGLLNALKSLDKLQILSLAYNIFNNSNYILSWLNNLPLTTLNMTSCLRGFTSSNSIKVKLYNLFVINNNNSTHTQTLTVGFEYILLMAS